MVFLLNVNHFKQDYFLPFFHHLLKQQHQLSRGIFVKGTHLPRKTPPPLTPVCFFTGCTASAKLGLANRMRHTVAKPPEACSPIRFQTGWAPTTSYTRSYLLMGPL